MKKLFLSFAVLLFWAAAVFGGQPDYPEPMKNEVGLYPGAKVIQTIQVSGATLVVLESGDTAEKLFDFYKKELTAKGWTTHAEYKVENHMSLVMVKKDWNMVIDIGSDQPDRRTVNLTLTPPEAEQGK